jgi:transcriptional regulator with XRE-family HTH domain
MSYRSKTISKLLSERESRESYVRAKLNQLIPSQIRALRLRQTWTQKQLGEKAEMKQARISAVETTGEVNFSLETLVRIASALRVGLKVEFVPYSEMMAWENRFSQDSFTVLPLEKDEWFLSPQLSKTVHYPTKWPERQPFSVKTLKAEPSVGSPVTIVNQDPAIHIDLPQDMNFYVIQTTSAMGTNACL